MLYDADEEAYQRYLQIKREQRAEIFWDVVLAISSLCASILLATMVYGVWRGLTQ